MLSILLSKQKSQNISVKNAFSSSSFPIINFMEGKKKKSFRFFWLFRIDRKDNSKRRHALSRQKGVVRISLYGLKPVMIPQENKSDFRSYTAKVKMPWHYKTNQQAIQKISVAASFILKYFWREIFSQVHFLGGSVGQRRIPSQSKSHEISNAMTVVNRFAI